MRTLSITLIILLSFSCAVGKPDFFMSRLNKESISELVGKARPDKDWGNRVFSYSNNVRKVDDELSGVHKLHRVLNKTGDSSFRF